MPRTVFHFKQRPVLDIDDLVDVDTSGNMARAVPIALVANATIAKKVVAPSIDVRPQLGAGPERVEFGLFVKTFYGMDLKHGTFTADIVMSLRWLDNRTAALVPDGKPSVTFSQESASATMWMPDITVSNRDLNGIEVISTAVTATDDGKVTKVERMLVVAKNKYDIKMFPFDMQTLIVKLASTSLMSDEVELVPSKDPDLSGVKDGVFDGKDVQFEGFTTRSYEEVDGPLKKSRGTFDLKLQRDFGPHFESMLLPDIILIGIAWTVFVFPLTAAFTMPRVATSMISYLALTNFMFRTSAILPTRSTVCWIDIFEESCQFMMFGGMIFNIASEVIFHDMGLESLAKRMQTELQIGFPVVAIIVFSLAFFCNTADWLEFLTWSSRGVLLLVMLGYLALCGARAWGAERAAQRAQREAVQKGSGMVA